MSVRMYICSGHQAQKALFPLLLLYACMQNYKYRVTMVMENLGKIWEF